MLYYIYNKQYGSKGAITMGPDEKMNERVKEMLVQKAIEAGVPLDEIERMYNVKFVNVNKDNPNKHSYSETKYYGNLCKVTTTVIDVC